MSRPPHWSPTPDTFWWEGEREAPTASQSGQEMDKPGLGAEETGLRVSAQKAGAENLAPSF